MAGEGGFIENLKESYENLVSSLEEKGVPAPRILVPAVGIIILIALLWLALPGLFSPTSTVEFTIVNAQGQPVSGASVTLTAGDYSEAQPSGPDGKVSFEKVPAGKELEVAASSIGYQSKSGTVTNGGTFQLSPVTVNPQAKSFKINVQQEDGTSIEGAAVILTFSDGTTREGVSDAFGDAVFDVGSSTLSMATAEVTADGFESKRRTVNTDDGTVTIRLAETGGGQPPETRLGDFIVRVDGANADGVAITLVDPVTSSSIAQAAVDSTNKALFPHLALNSMFYITASDQQGRYENYEDPTTISFERNLQEETVTLHRAERREDAIAIIVKDESGNAIRDASVSIYDRTTRVLYGEDSTDASGSVEFQVAGKAYYITAFKDGFLPGAVDSAKKGDRKTITLEKEKPGNFVEASVVVKENTDPVPDAEVSFFKSNAFPLGVPTVSTSADGTGMTHLPLQADGKNYKAFAAARSGVSIGRSDLVDVAEGVEFAISVQAPPANLTLQAKSLVSNATVEGAFFSLIAPDNSIVKECSSPCSILVPGNLEYRAVATAAGFMQTTTAPFSLEPNEKKTVQIGMYPTTLSKRNTLAFIGFFDRAGNQVSELQRAETYYAKFMLSLSEKSDAFAFFQAGESADLASEPVEITGYKTAAAPKKALYGETAENVCANDVDKTQPDTLKWLELGYAQQLGASEIVLEFRAKQNAPAGSALKILYRASGFANSVPFTSPQDDSLVSQLLSQAVHDRSVFCQAKTATASIKVQSTPMACKNGLCSRVTLEREDGLRVANNLDVQIGQQFNLNFDLFAPGESIDSVTLEEDPTIEIVAGSVSQLSLAERTFQATGTDRSSGTILIKALKPSVKTTLNLKVVFAADREPITLQRGIQITGTNEFTVSFNPSQASIGQTVRGKAIVLDKLQRPVTDAELSLFECAEQPVLGGETQIMLGTNSMGRGRDGQYEFRFTPQTIGDVCLEVRGDGFETKQLDPALTATAEAFLGVTPEAIAFTGPTDQQTGRQVQVDNSLQGVKIRVQAVIDAQCRPFLSVIPGVQQNVQDSTQFTIGLTSFDAVQADCNIEFVGEANANTRASAILAVHIDTDAPNGTIPPSSLPSCAPAGECLTQDQANGLTTTCRAVSGFSCTDLSQSCFVCGNGLDNVQAVALTVSNLRNDRKVYPLHLNFQPAFDASYDLVWDQQFNTMMPLQNQPQLVTQTQVQTTQFNPYTMPYAGVSQPLSTIIAGQYQYQPYYSQNTPFASANNQQLQNLPRVPELQNPFLPSGGIAPSALTTGYAPESYGTQYPYQRYQGYQLQSGQYYNQQAYPGLVAGQPVFPPYCQNFRYNVQAGFGNAQANIWSNPYSYGVPQGMTANCQYPYICNSPQLCGFAQFGGSNWQVQLGFNTGGSACSYPNICSNPSACGQMTNIQPNGISSNTPQITYKQVSSPVKVDVSITKDQLTVSGTYTGDEYFFNGGLPATAKGELIIRDSKGLEKKRVPITITVGYSGTIPQQQTTTTQTTVVQPIPQPYPVPIYQPPIMIPQQIPPECMAPFFPPVPLVQAASEGEFPSPALVAVNICTGKGRSEYEFTPPYYAEGVPLASTDVPKVKASVKDTTLAFAASYPAGSFEDTSGIAKLSWGKAAGKKAEVPFDVIQDDFNPQKILLFMRDGVKADVAQYEDSRIASGKCDTSKLNGVASIKCSNGLLTATAKKPGTGTLTIKKDEYGQIREIPVQVVTVKGTGTITLAQSSGKWVGQAKFTFDPVITLLDKDQSVSVSTSTEGDDTDANCQATTEPAEFKGDSVTIKVSCDSVPSTATTAKIKLNSEDYCTSARANVYFEIPVQVTGTAPAPVQPQDQCTTALHTNIKASKFCDGTDYPTGCPTEQYFSALPSTQAIGRWIKVCAAGGGNCQNVQVKSVDVPVLSVGPWCEADDEYVLGDDTVRPYAEEWEGTDLLSTSYGKALQCHNTMAASGSTILLSNGAGIDLNPALYDYLELDDHVAFGSNLPKVNWCFIDTPDDHIAPPGTTTPPTAVQPAPVDLGKSKIQDALGDIVVSTKAETLTDTPIPSFVVFPEETVYLLVPIKNTVDKGNLDLTFVYAGKPNALLNEGEDGPQRHRWTIDDGFLQSNGTIKQNKAFSKGDYDYYILPYDFSKEKKDDKTWKSADGVPHPLNFDYHPFAVITDGTTQVGLKTGTQTVTIGKASYNGIAKNVYLRYDVNNRYSVIYTSKKTIKYRIGLDAVCDYGLIDVDKNQAFVRVEKQKTGTANEFEQLDCKLTGAADIPLLRTDSGTFDGVTNCIGALDSGIVRLLSPEDISKYGIFSYSWTQPAAGVAGTAAAAGGLAYGIKTTAAQSVGRVLRGLISKIPGLGRLAGATVGTGVATTVGIVGLAWTATHLKDVQHMVIGEGERKFCNYRIFAQEEDIWVTLESYKYSPEGVIEGAFVTIEGD